MRIVRPYGESRVEKHNSDEVERLLVRNTIGRERKNITDFARSHDELVIAQWISAIDKIARKPSSKDGATARQRDFRERLGAAALRVIEREVCLPGLAGERGDYLRKLWHYKIHPYGEQDYRPKRGRGEPKPEPVPDGRAFARFTDAPRPEDANADAIAERIYQHLYVGEFRAHADLPSQPMGRVERRAESIRRNTLGRREIKQVWSDADEQAYAAFNVAGEIREAALAREQRRDGSHVRYVTLDIAGSALYDHWARVFRDGDRVLSMTEAQERSPKLVELHKAVRDTYARVLKRHRKDQPEHNKGNRRESQRRVSDLLPRDMTGLYRLMGHQRQNRTLADLVRVGKVIHYSATVDDKGDFPGGETLWPRSVDSSAYWSSAGQAEIKRSEAFVRTWRNALALASRTLKDWADPDDLDNGDILTAAEQIGEKFAVNPRHFDLKLDLLFGERKRLVPVDLGARTEVLRQTIRDTYDLRNRVYHFKGRHAFLAGLRRLGEGGDPALSEIDQALWRTDCEGQHGVVLAALGGAHLHHFATEPEAAHLAKAIVGARDGKLPMPRFTRVLTRAKQAWDKEKKSKPDLPEPANRLELQVPARHLQYVAVKMLYERPFRPWLEDQSHHALTRWIDRAIARSTNAARNLNAKKDDPAFELIVSRAENLPRPEPGTGLEGFFFDLTAATASEMRVQRGYQSDAEAARKQASYIEDLKCDVVALAFSDFLANEGFAWLQTFDTSLTRPEIPAFEMLELKVPPPDTKAAPWQTRLYYLLHLIPVDEVGRLLHQLARWEVTSIEGDSYTDEEQVLLAGLRRAMVLYLDMHDAKFQGGSALAGCSEFQELFESDAAFNALFPAGEADPSSRVPRRGLREIARFGNLGSLKDWFGENPITMREITAVADYEATGEDGKSRIARLQAEREDLHAKWAKNKKQGLTSGDVRRYIDLMREVGEHRRQSNRVNLIDHLRAHRLFLAVAGRLVDYAGLFERDLFFVILAVCHDMGMTPKEVFRSGGYKLLQNGQTLSAIREILAVHKDAVYERIEPHFTDVYNPGNRARNIRNYFAHLNMFGGSPKDRKDLTTLVNDARVMMAYDRKLKNAVSQSIKDLVEREGFDLQWQMTTEGSDHNVCKARVQIRSATHLGGLKLTERTARPGKKWPMKHSILEALHSEDLVNVVARMFGGNTARVRDVSTLPIEEINFEALDQRTGGRWPRNPDQGGHQRPPRGQKPRRRKNKPNQFQNRGG